MADCSDDTRLVLERIDRHTKVIDEKFSRIDQDHGALRSRIDDMGEWKASHEKDHAVETEKLFGTGGHEPRIEDLETKTVEIDTHVEATDKTIAAVSNKISGAWWIIAGLSGLVALVWGFAVWAGNHLVMP